MRAGAGLDVAVAGVHYDSRRLAPGFVFVCIQGFRTDGHLYIAEARERGAVGLVVEKEVAVPEGMAWALVEDSRRALAVLAANFYGHPARQLALFGVTGTNGKTTTAHLIARLLEAGGKKVGLLGTVWNRIGDRFLPVTHTTPESLDLQQLLRQMVDSSVEAAVMEVSSHGLALARVAECEFDVGVFTNLTRDHLDFHRTFEDYFRAKALLFEGLGKGRTKERPCYAVLNADDPAGRELQARVRVRAVTYGLEGGEVRAEDVELAPRGSSFTVRAGGKRLRVFLPLPGIFNVYNCLAAVAVGLEEGLPGEVIEEALREAEGVPGRFEVVDAGQDFTVVVDYAHTPDGLAQVLRAARALTTGRLITVFGCGGDRDPGKRSLMGRVSGELSDVTVLTSDNPRSEDPLRIIAEIEEGIRDTGGEYLVEVDRYEAIRKALHLARGGDFVIIAGKGHESYQIFKDRVVPFSDRDVAREILEKEIVGRS